MIEYLSSVTEADFDGVKQREITLSFSHGKVLGATDYLNEFMLPNFYFHVSTAYAILRHNGVQLTKQDYIGSLNLREPSSPV